MSARHPIDQKLSDIFSRESAPISDALWDRLDASLNQKRKRRIIWYYFMSLTGALLLIGIGSYLVVNHCNKDDNAKAVVKERLDEPNQSNSNKQAEIIFPLNRSDKDESLPTVRINPGANGPKSSITRKKLKDTPLVQLGNNSGLYLNSKNVGLFADWNMITPLELGILDRATHEIVNIHKVDDNARQPKPIYLGVHFNSGALADGLKAMGGAENFINRSFFDVVNNSRSRFAQSNAGFDVAVKLNKQFMISSGFNVSRRMQAYEYNYSITEFPVVDQNRGIVSYLPLAPQDQIHVRQSSANVQNFIDVPLIAEWTFVRVNQFSAGLRSGVYVGRAFRPEGLIPDEGTLILTDLTDKMRSGWNGSGHLGVSLNYNAGERLMMSAEPIWIRNINTVSTPQSRLKSNPEMKGINIRVLYRINP